MQELIMMEVDEVSGGLMMELSSAFGHLGRAFGVGYAIGTAISDFANTYYGDSRMHQTGKD